MDVGTYKIANKVLGGYGLFLLIYGTATNLFCCAVCLRKRLRGIPTFIFLSFNTISEILVLYSLNLHEIYGSFNDGASIEATNYIWCHLALLVQAFGQYSAAWILTAMTIETCFSVKIKRWRISLFNSKRALVVSVLIVLAALLCTSYVIIGADYITLTSTVINNQTNTSDTQTTTFCNDTEIFYIQKKVELCAYSLIPFVLILAFSIVLAKAIYDELKLFKPANKKTYSRRRSLAITVIIKTLVFLCMSLPGEIAASYFYDAFNNTNQGRIIYVSIRLLDFTYHGLNSTFVMLLNSQICLEVKLMILKVTHHNFHDDEHHQHHKNTFEVELTQKVNGKHHV